MWGHFRLHYERNISQWWQMKYRADISKAACRMNGLLWMCEKVTKKQRKPLETSRENCTVSNDSHGKIKGSRSVTSCSKVLFFRGTVRCFFAFACLATWSMLCMRKRGSLFITQVFFNTILVSRFTTFFDMCSSPVCIWSREHCV